MSTTNEELLEGGHHQEQLNLPLETIHEGGNPPQFVGHVSSLPYANSVEECEGAESALQIGNTVAHSAASSSLSGGVAIPIFSFKSPFANPDQPEKNLEAQKENLYLQKTT